MSEISETPQSAERFFALRYVRGTALRDRLHASTVGRFPTRVAALIAGTERTNGHLLEVVVREVPAPKVVQRR